jgi:hypothetical protein
VTVAVRPIMKADLPAVGRFLHEELNPQVSEVAWANATCVPWAVDAPNHGFLLEDDGHLAGVYLAYYAERTIDGARERFCNLGAWCVRPSHRFHSLRLLKAILAQDGYTFTDLSPSGAVVPLNRRLKFQDLPTDTAIVPALPLPSLSRRIRIRTDVASNMAALGDSDLQIYRDHAAAAAAHHLVVSDGERSCYVMFRRDRRKGLPLFASILYVSDPELFHRSARLVARHLLVHHRVLGMLAELRVVGRRPWLSLMVDKPRHKMFKSDRVKADRIDYLYSELVCVAW